MALDDLLASDAAAVFLNGDDFAEPVTVSTDGVTERTVYAVVDRNPPASVSGNARRPSLRISFANHATRGILATSLNTGRTYVKVGTDRGAAATRIALTGKPASQDAGMITFEL